MALDECGLHTYKTKSGMIEHYPNISTETWWIEETSICFTLKVHGDYYGTFASLKHACNAARLIPVMVSI